MTGSRRVPGGLQGSARPAPARRGRSPGVRQPASLLLRLPFAWQGAVPDRLPHRVPPCSARMPALLPLPLPPGGYFSPLAELFTGHTAPELLYLESRWASLISFGMTAALLKDVLPVADTPETVRQHLLSAA